MGLRSWDCHAKGNELIYSVYEIGIFISSNMFGSNGTQNSSDLTHLPRQQQQASKISLSIIKCSIFRSLFNAEARSIFSLNYSIYENEIVISSNVWLEWYLSWFECLECLSSYWPYKINCTLSLKLV